MESKENPRPKFANENPWYTEKKLPQYKKPIQLILVTVSLKKHFS